MYRALYRAYRPRRFADVCGQPHVVRTLRRQVAEGQLSHAYLFTGSRGTGKTSCAKILAKAVNCLHPVDGDPCCECEICRGIDDESILDVIEIDAASNNGVDDIRGLRDNTAFSPAAGKYRVYIIDEVHMLSGAAFNALLKTLEEPPEHVLFILATTEVHKLPATVLSRCQRFDFRRIAPEDIADRLTYVAGQEGFELTREAALLIARLADGAMRDALSLLDVCRAEGGKVDEETVVACAGLSGREYLAALLRACFAGDTAAALTKLADLYAQSKDMGRLCAELVAYLRDLMLIKTLRQPERMLVGSAAEIDEQEKLAGQTSLETILHAMDVFEAAGERMRAGADRRTAA
ncbi:MAG: DNA polymerase III subunit gamma/tau, partial [Clostridia bacterium]|nr:DNA polymerase III subunit gamma/tau [Clostridia bacterium]